MMITADISHSVILSIHYSPETDAEAQVEALLRELGPRTILLDSVKSLTHTTLFIKTSADYAPSIINKINSLEGIGCAALDEAFGLHLGGKIEVRSRIAVTNREELALAYTPEVAKICMAIHHNPEQAETFTIRHNTVAVITGRHCCVGFRRHRPESGAAGHGRKSPLI